MVCVVSNCHNNSIVIEFFSLSSELPGSQSSSRLVYSMACFLMIQEIIGGFFCGSIR